MHQAEYLAQTAASLRRQRAELQRLRQVVEAAEGSWLPSSGVRVGVLTAEARGDGPALTPLAQT